MTGLDAKALEAAAHKLHEQQEIAYDWAQNADSFTRQASEIVQVYLAALPLPETVRAMVERLRKRAVQIDQGVVNLSIGDDTEEILSELRSTADLLTRLSRAAPGEGWQAPDGWKLVPVEPTFDMQRAAFEALELDMLPLVLPNTDAARAVVYRAMLASAPPAPTQEPGR